MVASLTTLNFAFGETCPSNTQVGSDNANLVGEVTDDGGDPDLTVWFQYGKTSSYGSETNRFSRYGTGLFCTTINNLDPCSTYYYKAIAENSAGTSYGNNKSFTTQCVPVSVDVKANNSDGPITIHHNDSLTLSWTSQNASYCTASGDWSGSKSVSGSEHYATDQTGTFTFKVTCYSSQGAETNNDSVQVTVSANLPVVVTKPAIVTY